MLHLRKNGLLSRFPQRTSFLDATVATPEWVPQDYGATLEMEDGWTLSRSGESDSGLPVGDSFYRQWADVGTQDFFWIYRTHPIIGTWPVIEQEFTQPTSKAVVYPRFIPPQGKDVNLYAAYRQDAAPGVGFIPTTVSFTLFGRSYALAFSSDSSQTICTISQDEKGHIFLDGEEAGFFPYYVFPPWLVIK